MNFKQKLASGGPLIGTFLKTPSPMVCELLGRTDLDVICIDAEHSPFDRMAIDQCILALQSVGMPSVVRIPATSAEHILNALDCGADGIVAPHIITKTDADFIAKKSQFVMGRGYAGSTRAAGYMAKNMQTHKIDSATKTTVIAQIEDVEALDNLDEILATDGIDCFFIGRSDLTISLGLENPNDPKVIGIVEDICKRAEKAGKCTGMFTGNLDEIAHWRALGASLFLLGSDHSFMLGGAKTLTENVRAQF